MDTIQINDADRTGQSGTARVIARFSANTLVGGMGGLPLWRPYKGAVSTFVINLPYIDPIAKTDILKVEGIETRITFNPSSPAVATFTFHYGEPFYISMETVVESAAFVAGYWGYHQPGPYSAEAGADADVYLTIVPDNPNATMTSVSGHPY